MKDNNEELHQVNLDEEILELCKSASVIAIDAPLGYPYAVQVNSNVPSFRIPDC